MIGARWPRTLRRMKIERILTATDFSEAGQRAVTTAARLAHRIHAALHIVHVLPPKRWLTSGWRADAKSVEAIGQRAEVTLQNLTQRLDHVREIKLTTAVLTGAAASTLACEAQNTH